MSEKELSELARQAQNQYQREWRAKNKDKVRARNERYWAKKAIELQNKEVSNDDQ